MFNDRILRNLYLNWVMESSGEYQAVWALRLDVTPAYISTLSNDVRPVTSKILRNLEKWAPTSFEDYKEWLEAYGLEKVFKQLNNYPLIYSALCSLSKIDELKGQSEYPVLESDMTLDLEKHDLVVADKPQTIKEKAKQQEDAIVLLNTAIAMAQKQKMVK